MKIIFVVNELDFFIRTHFNLAININQTHEVELIADASKSSTNDLDLIEKMGIKLHVLNRKKNSKNIFSYLSFIFSLLLLLRKIKPDYVFALHNIPGFTSNEVFCKANEITPAVVSIKVSFKGKTAHAAEPENGINPSIAISDFIRFCEDLQVNDKNSDDFLVLTPIHINMGEIAYGISAGEGEIHYTIRCWNNLKIKETKNKIESFLNKISIDQKISVSFNYLEEFHSNQNNVECVEVIKQACEINNIKYNSMNSPFKWGEDFGIFTDKFKGALFGLGAGVETPSLHNPDYDFPDYLTEKGIQIFKSIWEII